ncbi:MAG TPA: gliding motility-associated C-terminal domain-containing protein [Bacteroidales bacterium]|nr:gliding motility-associated C-terminal domain-containing protein [Bacteroidales bacterium]
MKKISILAALLFIVSVAHSQNYLISAGGTVTACSENFYDSGNYGGNYSNNENFVMTFHSNNPTNTHLRFSFNVFDVEPGDTLIVYDGSSVTATVLGKYNNNNLPPAYVFATIYNLTGDLTFQFKSNASLNNGGWWASFVCTPACQEINAIYHPGLTVPPPNDSNYIDICVGQTITFGAKGSGAAFPQSGINYTQDSTNCVYLWDFGDGTTATGQIVTHTYTVVRGYDIGLTITDARGCVNSNYLGGRVRISSNPIASIDMGLLPDICSNSDTTYINYGYGPGSVITIDPTHSVQSASEKFDSTMFIPDGPNCPIQCYNTFVTFMAFIPGATITSAADILSICVNMEHSYTGDLGFRIICPNGQSVQLDPNTHSGGAYMGVPAGGANHHSFDSGCDPANNLAGTGWTYCWSSIYPQHGTMDALSSAGVSPIDSTNTINNTNYITPSSPLSGLIGCPLNGTWNIEICDDFGSDNGYIFWWELNLDPSLLPVGWSYQVPIDTVIWTGNGDLEVLNDSTIMIVPGAGGSYQYNVEIIDVFGCSYDTTLTIGVVQAPQPELGPSDTLCDNNLNFILSPGPADEYIWSTGSTDSIQPVSSTGYYYVTMTNHNANNTLDCISSDSVFIKVLAYPTPIDLGPDTCSTVPFPLDAEHSGGVFQYNWSTGATTQTINAVSSGTYSVTVAELFDHNCELSDSRNVTIIPEPTIEIGPDSTICSFNYFRMKVKDANGFLDNNPYTYLWTTDPVSNLNGLTSREVDFGCLTPDVVYNVGVAVTGCTTVTDTRVITAKNCELEVFNIITPNGDTYNDKFKVTGLENFAGSNMKIYNRWGKKVYESDNYGMDDSELWDGGKDADGVYYYVLTVNYGDSRGCVEALNYHGTVTIIR